MLEELFFSKNAVKTVEYFVLHEMWEQNQKDLCDALEIYQKAMKLILEKLVEYEIIKKTKQIAKSKFYKLNQESDLIKPLRLLSKRFGYQMALLDAKKQEENGLSESQLSKISEEVNLNG